MKKGFMLLLSAIFIILALFSVNGLSIFDDFDDNTLDTNIWDNTDKCTEQNQRLECIGNNDFQKTLSLETLGFDYTKDWNIEFDIVSASGVEWHPFMSTMDISLGFNNPLDYTGGGERFWGARQSSTNYQRFNLTTYMSNAAFSATKHVILKKNITGYYMFVAGTITMENDDSTYYPFIVLALGDPMADNTGTTMYIDNFNLTQAEIPPVYSVNIALDKNTTTNQSIFMNFTITGNMSYIEILRDSVLVSNSSDINFTDIGLINNTDYFYIATAFYNSSIYNSTNFTLKTLQNQERTDSERIVSLEDRLLEVENMLNDLAIIILELGFLALTFKLFQARSNIAGFFSGFSGFGLDFILISTMMTNYPIDTSGTPAGIFMNIGTMIFYYSFPITRIAFLFIYGVFRR